MKLQFLGTSSGRTSLNKFHTSFLIGNGENDLLIDAGDGISKAIISAGRSFCDITAIIITHCHSDHFCGLPSLLTQMIMDNRTKPLKIIIHKNLKKNLISLLNISNIFIEQVAFKIEIVPVEVDEWIKPIENVKLMMRQNTHIRNKYFENVAVPGELQFSSVSILFEVADKNICYTSDVGSVDDLYLFKDFKIDWFITESAHITFEEITTVAKKLQPQKLIVTHIPDKVRDQLAKLTKEGGYILSDDRMILKL